ncbi:hypothetical protein MRX96_021108 [Rhipicephalus microplus]
MNRPLHRKCLVARSSSRDRFGLTRLAERGQKPAHYATMNVATGMCTDDLAHLSPPRCTARVGKETPRSWHNCVRDVPQVGWFLACVTTARAAEITSGKTN